MTALNIPTQSWLPWNDLAPMAYTSVRNSGNILAMITQASRYALGEMEAASSNGVYLKNDEIITFDQSALTFAPKPRDTIQPQGLDTRVVLEVSQFNMLNYFELKVRDLIIAYDLQDTCTINRSAPTPDANGLRQRNPTAIYTGVACRLQPLDVQVDFDDPDRVNQTSTYTCFLGQPILLQSGDTIVVSSVEYEVKSQSDISSFDTLTSVTVERIR